MDGSRLPCDVTSDSALDLPSIQESMRKLDIKDFAKGPLSAVEIDPRLSQKGCTDSGISHSILTSSIDSAYDSIPKSLSLKSDCSLVGHTPSLQTVPESTSPGVRHDTKEVDEFDEGFDDDLVIIERGDVIEPKKVKIVEAEPLSSENDADMFKPNEDGDNYLHLSIIFMLPERIYDILLRLKDVTLLNRTNYMMQTPLILAALTRQARVVRRLMVAGADIEKTDRHGDTALHIACRNGDEEMVKKLVTPLTSEELRMYPCLYDRYCQRIPQDLNQRNYDGYTPFHLATIGGHLTILTILSNLEADVDSQEGRNGKRAIHLAVDQNSEKTIRHLVEECAVDIDATTFYNLSPVMLAADKRLHRVVEYLVQCGADHSDLDCSEVSDEESSEDIEMVYDDFKINGEPIHS